MIDDDFSKLGNLWTADGAQPDTGAIPDLVELKTAVSRAARRDRVFLVLESISAAAICLIVIIVMLKFPEPGILVSGVLILVSLIASTAYVVHSRRQSGHPEGGDASTLLTMQAKRMRRSIKRYEAGLYAFLPATLLGSVFGNFLVEDNRRSEALESGLGGLAGWPLLVLSALVFVGVGCCSIYLLRKEKEKLSHIETLLAGFSDRD